jgi:hypothetical protein
MSREGRKVGKLVQDPVTGYWREEVPTSRAIDVALDAPFVVEAFENGFTRGEITLILRRDGIGVDASLATLYRQVDEVLLAAGHRARAAARRRGGRRSGCGEAALPAILAVMR